MDKLQAYQRDIRDIFYFIDHIHNEDALCDVIEKLGYKIGVNVITKSSVKKNITIGKRQELRIQLTDTHPTFPLVACAIIE